MCFSYNPLLLLLWSISCPRASETSSIIWNLIVFSNYHNSQLAAEDMNTGRSQGRPQDLAGGVAKNFFFRCQPCALIGGVRGHAPPPENFFLKWCNLVRFGVYLDQILSLK